MELSEEDRLRIEQKRQQALARLAARQRARESNKRVAHDSDKENCEPEPLKVVHAAAPAKDADADAVKIDSAVSLPDKASEPVAEAPPPVAAASRQNYEPCVPITDAHVGFGRKQPVAFAVILDFEATCWDNGRDGDGGKEDEDDSGGRRPRIRKAALVQEISAPS